jgi:uncharacterized protein YbjT (DUF2867 family)
MGVQPGFLLMSKPIITVFGATGAQGGGLARALLDDPGRHFAVRAVTRKPDGAAGSLAVTFPTADALIGASIGVAGDHLSGAQLAANKSRIPVAKAA